MLMPFGVGFYLFGSKVFGDTSETDKVIVHVFLLSYFGIVGLSLFDI